MDHSEWTYVDDEGPQWLDLDSDGEAESVLSVVEVSAGRSWGQVPDTGWGYDDAE